MKYLQFVLLIMLLFEEICAISYSYSENFEGNTQPVIFWTKGKTAKYKLDTIGITSALAYEGQKSLKLTVTLYGDTVNPQNSTYYYWWIPLSPVPNLLDSVAVSARLWVDSTSIKYVTLCTITAFPPTNVGGCTYNEFLTPKPTTVDSWNTFTANKILGNINNVVQKYVYGALPLDYGSNMTGLAILIEAAGMHQLTIYLDDIRIQGRIMDSLAYSTFITTHWNAYKSRIDTIMTTKHNTFNMLSPIPDTTGHSIGSLAKSWYNQLLQMQSPMALLINEMDSISNVKTAYFEPSKMDSLNNFLSRWPVLISYLKNEMATGNKVSLLNMLPTKYFHYTGQNLAPWNNIITSINLRICRGEYKPTGIVIVPKQQFNSVNCRWGEFIGGSSNIPASVLDIRVVKLWFQANDPSKNTTTKGTKTLVQELLIKNDSLVKVVDSTNYLRMQTKTGEILYSDISSPTAAFDSSALIFDSDSLLPFSLDSMGTKQLWLTFHIPESTPSGIYNGSLLLFSQPAETLSVIPISIQVLPFDLEPSRLAYSIYYEAMLTDDAIPPYSSRFKDTNQLKIELTDMWEHGIMHPYCSQSLNLLGKYLSVCNRIGFSPHRFYTQGITTDSVKTQEEIHNKKIAVAAYIDSVKKYGYDSLFVYGIDERSGPALAAQRPAWKAVHDTGAFVFVAGYNDLLDTMKELINVGVIAGALRPDYAARFHSMGNQIYSYGNPQVGVENPEVYRRNYGLALWKAGYDGAMDWAYQRNYGAFWNDFDNRPNSPRYREETFTYPTSNGVIPTIQWEGFREAVNDVRYISTLLNHIDAKKKQGENVSSYEQFVQSINPSDDLDQLRSEIIDNIISINGGISIRKYDTFLPSSPLLFNVTMLSSNRLRVIWNLPVAPKSVNVHLYSISGRRVATIFAGKMETGIHTTTFKTNKIATGIYYLRVVAEPIYQITKKIQILK